MSSPDRDRIPSTTGPAVGEPGPPVLPFGTWPSPIAAGDLAASTSFAQLTAVGDRLAFTRTDPTTGQQRLCCWDAGSGLEEAEGLGAGELDVRSRVHEYGGGAIATLPPGAVPEPVVVDFAGQRLHRVRAGAGRTTRTTTTLTPDTGATVRYAAAVGLADGRLVAVRETHLGTSAEQVRNELVLLDPAADDPAGSAVVLDGDHDFVTAPRPGPGGWLAWLAWDHPDMPWDGAALWLGRLRETSTGTVLTGTHRVAGGDDVAVSELVWWGADLLFTEDATGFWELVHHDPRTGASTRLTADGADLGHPRWTHGADALAVVEDPGHGEVAVAVRTREARAELVVVDLSRGADGTPRPTSARPWPSPTGEVRELVFHAGAVATLEVDVDGRRAVRLRGLDGSLRVVDEVDPPTARPGDLGGLQAVTVGDGADRCHAFLHLPANADARGPDGAAPPLVVLLHGGPTGQSFGVRSAAVAFWTTRGFAVADVNYRGSAGFGRVYRDALRGRWGEAEVADVIAVATELGRRGLVDPAAMAVRGGSAGGFTTLAVLTSPDQPFACGTSFFGVADLAALAEHTHKFESRYLDRMVGPLPEAADVYRERSPLTHTDRLAVPLLVLQGTEDKVVPPTQAEVIVEAARTKGLLHDYLVFEGEGHGFRRPENIVTWHEAELAFYREAMGLG